MLHKPKITRQIIYICVGSVPAQLRDKVTVAAFLVTVVIEHTYHLHVLIHTDTKKTKNRIKIHYVLYSF